MVVERESVVRWAKPLLRAQAALLVLFLLPRGQAFSTRVSDEKSIRPSIDVAQFLDPQGNSYMEIYYAIPESRVKYLENEAGKYSCQLVVDIQIFLREALWTNKIWKIEKEIDDVLALAEGSQLVDVLRYYVDEASDYKIVMRVKDMNQPDVRDSAQVTFSARDLGPGRLRISDMELSSHIAKSAPDASGNFTKNTYHVMPSPGVLFGGTSSNIYYYFEAYGLTDAVPQDVYKVVCKVVNSSGHVMDGVGLNHRTKRKVNDTSIEVGMLNVASLPSGKYTLVYGIADAGKDDLAINDKAFYVYNPQVAAADNTIALEGEGLLAQLAEKELDEEFAKLILVNSEEDRQIYKQLSNAAAKRKFILDIWKRRNEDGLPWHVYRGQYLLRARFAEDKYNSVFNKGWNSDRGRVFILYGSPAEVQRFPSTETTVPYEVWRYDKVRRQGAVEFVFADREGFNKFELLHSNLPGETRDPNWKSRVFKGTNERQFRIR